MFYLYLIMVITLLDIFIIIYYYDEKKIINFSTKKLFFL